MHRLVLALGITVLAVLAAPTLAQAQPTAVSAARCGNLPSALSGKIVTRGVRCATARRVVRRWANNDVVSGSNCPNRLSRGYGSCSFRLSRYRCRYRVQGHEAASIRCQQRSRVVRWLTGA